MTRRRSSLLDSILVAVGLIAMFGVSKVITRISSRAPEPHERPLEHDEACKKLAHDETGKPPATDDGGHSKSADLVSYGAGYILALVLTCFAFALVYWRWLSGTTAFAVVLCLALAQALVHFRCFLHVRLDRSARDDLQLVLFTTVIICLMVGGTLVVLFNLRLRMM